MATDNIERLLSSDEPWTRYRTLVELLDRPAEEPEVETARLEMLAHRQIQTLITAAAAWPGYALKRHDDAKHPLFAFSTLADFGLRVVDPGLATGLGQVLARQSPEGAFLTQLQPYKQFGGLEGEHWVWLTCDAPTLLYVPLAMGLGAGRTGAAGCRASGWTGPGERLALRGLSAVG
jgi:hypothetical protein